MALSAQFEHELKKRIAEEIERLRSVMGNRPSVPNIGEYHYLVGQIDALKRVTDSPNSYCDEVNTELDKR